MIKMNPDYKYRWFKKSVFTLFLLFFIPFHSFGQLGDYASHEISGRSVVITDDTGDKIRITPYGDYMARIQMVQSNEEFYTDDHYYQVERHDWEGTFNVSSSVSSLTLSTAAADGISISVTKNPLRLSFLLKTKTEPVLAEKEGIEWRGTLVIESFVSDESEHFAGLGHPKYGRLGKLDRRGTSVNVTSGSEGACVAPFYVSSKGYGIFLNTTFPHLISFGAGSLYTLEINGEGYGGRMDYFFIAGPRLPKVVDRYTQLTGRPRLPMKSIFGLHLSDKSDPQNNGEQWWKSMITNHRDAGYPLDHQVNDNAWRQSNEQYSAQNNSWFEWRTKDRYPDPAAYREWLDENGMTMTLDLNRPGIYMIPSWKDEYGIPGTENCPDFTNPETNQWLTELFNNVAYNPSLGVPTDAIWLDEFDYPDHDHSITLHSGKKWAEESINYHFNLMKVCVEEGWDPRFGESKRPYYWVRGITAGAQRYGTYWTGDLCHNWRDMTYQVRAMQSAGISGFPYFNHDAGGHYGGYGDNTCDNAANVENLVRQWDYGFGSFTPIWKPHGPSHTRWPLQQNSQASRNDAMKYCRTRYEMMPYIYSYAHLAARTGMPMARSMFFEDPENETAWDKDMQYYWGREMLVAPNCSDGNNDVSVWFPKGDWYDYWNDDKIEGNTTVSYYAATGVQPVFVRAGAIIPKAPYAMSTFRIPKDSLTIHVYTGADGDFSLYEDDGSTEKYRTEQQFHTTQIHYKDENRGVTISAVSGSYDDAPEARAYSIIYHGLTDAPMLYFNGMAITSYSSRSDIPADEIGQVWNSAQKLTTVVLPMQDVKQARIVSTDPAATFLNSSRNSIFSPGALSFATGKLIIKSLPLKKPVSITFFQMNGRILHKESIIEPERSVNGYTYTCEYPAFSSGICIVDIHVGGKHLSKKVLISHK
jgi:alpha-glucosidase (family GH31 glycosyl hydrolase)